MTDYSSQRKSRNPNVVHLNNCKDHRAYYVALSRGFTAEDTVIVQGFDPHKITGGIMSGCLRQELRELELLDEITRLRVEGHLPPYVNGTYRGQLIQSYRMWKGKAQEPSHFHPALRWNANLDSEVADVAEYGAWHPTVPDKSPIKAPKVSKRRAEDYIQSPAKRHDVHQPPTSVVVDIQQSSPVGLVWDNVNYSCGYDAFLTPLTCLWRDNPILWTEKLSRSNQILGQWEMAMTQMQDRPELARDCAREILHFQDPQKFPRGPQGLVLDSLFMAVTDRKVYGSASSFCNTCGYQAPGRIDTFSQYMNVGWVLALHANNPAGPKLSQWFEHHFNKPTTHCPCCANTSKLRRQTTIHEVPLFMIVNSGFNNLRLDEELTFFSATGGTSLRLRGLIYHSPGAVMGHFTSVLLDRHGSMWYHDGITTGRFCTANGLISDLQDVLSLQRGPMLGEVLCAALYAQVI
jgi:hypothetical protein